MKICALGAGLFHADRLDLADSRFSQFCERSTLVYPRASVVRQVGPRSTLLGASLDVCLMPNLRA